MPGEQVASFAQRRYTFKLLCMQCSTERLHHAVDVALHDGQQCCINGSCGDA